MYMFEDICVKLYLKKKGNVNGRRGFFKNFKQVNLHCRYLLKNTLTALLKYADMTIKYAENCVLVTRASDINANQ